MKVVFLDIDGVLNTSDTFQKRYFKYQKTGIISLEIDEFRLKYLKNLIIETDAKIVLTSTWRIFFKKEFNSIKPISEKSKELSTLFSKYGIEIYDMTPFIETRWREKEIELWLNNNEVDSFVIFDDEDYDLQNYKDNLILIKDDKHEFNQNKNGLSKKHINDAINILNKKNIYKKKKLIKR